MYQYVFGPVPSRRLGMSLGVDLVPLKVCSLNCVYCEVGKTTNLTFDRKEYIPYDKIVEELNHYFEHHPDPDHITFSGSGEPTLNSRIGDIIDFLKETKPNVPIAVITNGTLFYDPEVRKEILKADVVLPSLDAVSQEAFKKINRPPVGFDIDKYVQGLIDFSKEFTGKIWLEVLLLPGYNCDEKEITAFEKVISQINPDSIQLNTLDRPGAINGLVPASKEQLEKIANSWNFKNVEVISAAANGKQLKSYEIDTEAVILSTISRRPATIQDLSKTLGMTIHKVHHYLKVLEEEQRIEAVEQERGVFYRIGS